VSIVAALVLVVAVAAAIALPLMPGRVGGVDGFGEHDDTELFEREKNVALLAIKEAEFDHAMGKLSADDYGSLRKLYEQRALGALAALDRIHDVAPPAGPASTGSESASAPFCSGCGRPFTGDDRFCAGCGTARRHLDG